MVSWLTTGIPVLPKAVQWFCAGHIKLGKQFFLWMSLCVAMLKQERVLPELLPQSWKQTGKKISLYAVALKVGLAILGKDC